MDSYKACCAEVHITDQVAFASLHLCALPGHALLQPCTPPLPDGAPIEDYTGFLSLAEIFHIISVKVSSSQEVQMTIDEVLYNVELPSQHGIDPLVGQQHVEG